jgi:hypothetical protein
MLTYSCAVHNLLLAGIANTPSGKQTILDEGAVPSIVRLLGSRCPRVVSAAVSTVRNLSSPEDFAVSTALFEAGASTMLVHVVGCNTGEPCCTVGVQQSRKFVCQYIILPSCLF